MSISNADHLCINCLREKADDGVCPYCGFDESTYELSPHHLQPRSILGGKCLIGRVLGEGGFGITYIGLDLNLDLKLAIKEYYPTGFVTRTNTTTNTVTPYRGEKAEFFTAGRSRFINEAKTLAKFYALPGIVSVRDFFLENGTAYIVMEFVEGETLKQQLARVGGKMPLVEVFDLVRPFLRSLAEMHAAGLIHRDISPDNIMITPEGNVKLIDFGSARDYLDSGNRSLSVMLKPGYAPQEQYFARGLQGPWTDIYALSATIYRAITGITPPESVERLRRDELKVPSAIGIAISPALEAALLKGLAVSHEDRWQSIPELYAVLYPDKGSTVSIQKTVIPVKANDEMTKPIIGGADKHLGESSVRPHRWKTFVGSISSTKRMIPFWIAVMLLVAVVFSWVWGENSNGSVLSNAAAITAQENATPTQALMVAPTATASNIPGKVVESKGISTPNVAVTPKPTATAAPKPTATTASVPTVTATPKPTATAATGAPTGWSSWVESLPGGISSPTYSIESKAQYRDITLRLDFFVNEYRYQFADGSWTDWTEGPAPEGTINSDYRTRGAWTTIPNGDWVDGSKSAYSPNLIAPQDYQGVQSRTVYRYKHN